MNRVRLDGILDVVCAKGNVSLHSQVITYMKLFSLAFPVSHFFELLFPLLHNESTTFHFEMKTN